MNSFRPKTAVVAGVGPGSGAAIARKLAKEGCAVGLIARSEDYLKLFTHELGATKVAWAKADLSDTSQVKTAFKQLHQTLGPIDLLVFHASAGGPFGQGVVDIDPQDFARSWAVGTWEACFVRKPSFQRCSRKGLELSYSLEPPLR